jgi:putative effector of murein hydrolase LrgA (UPF0299 family)
MKKNNIKYLHFLISWIIVGLMAVALYYTFHATGNYSYSNFISHTFRNIWLLFIPAGTIVFSAIFLSEILTPIVLFLCPAKPLQAQPPVAPPKKDIPLLTYHQS